MRSAQIQTETGSGAHFAIDKGISEGPGMVADWWARMLEHMHRMSEEQKRAILKAYPNPIKYNFPDKINSFPSLNFKVDESSVGPNQLAGLFHVFAFGNSNGKWAQTGPRPSPENLRDVDQRGGERDNQLRELTTKHLRISPIPPKFMYLFLHVLCIKFWNKFPSRSTLCIPY